MQKTSQVPGLFVIAWVNTLNGTKGHGDPKRPVDYETARAWVERMNQKYPHINHAECSPGELQRFMAASPIVDSP